MALPSSMSTVIVTGKFLSLDGDPLTGRVIFSTSDAIDFPGSDTILYGDVIADLGVTGTFTVTLPATDNSTVPETWSYTVTEDITDVTRPRRYHILLPSSPSAVNLADIAPTDMTTPDYVPVAGASAYEIAVENGFTGTEQEWLESLGGIQGEPGVIQEVNGKSAASITLTAADVNALPDTGGTVEGAVAVDAHGTNGIHPLGLPTAVDSLSVLSSFAGGEDDGTGTDSTGRINLYSYQRASTYSYGENIRHFLMRGNAKSMDAWYFADGGYDANLDPVGNFKPVVWTGAHWQANDGLSNHKHWSVETPDSTGAIQTRFEVRWGNPAVGNAIAGLDKTIIATNLADFVVRCTSGQELRMSGAAGTEKGISFNHDYEGSSAFQRWKIRCTSDTESGSNAGSNFQVVRYDDAGVFLDAPITISRSTGNVTISPGFIARRSTSSVTSLSLNTTSLGGGVGVIAIGNASTPSPNTPSGGGVLYAQDGALVWKGSSGTVTTIAPA